MSSKTARADFSNLLASIRWVVTIVGAVSPDPITARICGSVIRKILQLLPRVQPEQNALGVVRANHDQQG